MYETGAKVRGFWVDSKNLCRLLIEVVATPATICDKTLTRQQNHVAKLLCLQHPDTKR